MSKCRIANCKSVSICEETNVCMTLCESKTHFHCSFSDCEETNNICSESINFRCIYHCFEKKHSHCFNKCKNLKECDLTSQCKSHCTSKNHGHCSDLWCNSENFCDDNTRNACSKCCWESNHSHCSRLSCNSKDFCKKSKKSECVKCCDVEHGHCISPGCDETENMCTKFKCKKHLNQGNHCISCHEHYLN